MTPSTASSFFWKPNSPRRGACPMVTSPTSRTRMGTPLLRSDYDVSNVIRVSDQSDAANVVELSALRVEAAAGI